MIKKTILILCAVLGMMALSCGLTGAGKQKSLVSEQEEKATEAPDETPTNESNLEERFYLDSIVCPEEYKVIFFYDSKGDHTMTFDYEWNTKKKSWDEYGIDKYEYDNKGRITTYYHNEEKNEYLYDDNGYLVKRITSIWNKKTSDWNTEYLYDDKGRLTAEIHRHNNRNQDEKTEYAYNQRGNMTKKTWYEWDEDVNDWKPSNKTDYTYNGKGCKTGSISYLADDGDWYKMGTGECIYYNDGNLMKEIHRVPDGYVESEYDKKGHIIKHIEDGGGATLVYKSTYDDNGNRTKSIHYNDESWGNKDYKPVNYYEYLFTLDNSHSQADFIAFNGYDFVNMLTAIKHIDRGEKTRNYTCYWSVKMTDISEPDEKAIERVNPLLKHTDYVVRFPDEIY